MSRLASRFLPDEWLSAFSSLREMVSEVRRSSGATVRHVAGFLMMWIPGALLGAVAWRGILPELAKGDIGAVDSLLKAIMTMVSVLTGFMITLMLFTGKTEAWKALNLEQARAFAEKSTYLLFSQFVTLANHVMVVLCCVVWFFLYAQGLVLNTQWVIILLCAFLLVSLFRTILVPLQIAELHRFALEALLADKEEELRVSIRKARAAAGGAD